MKHPLKLTLILLLMFLTAQIVGLMIIKEYVNISESKAKGMMVTNDNQYSRIGFEPPAVKNPTLSFIFILLSVLAGTGLILLLIKLGKGRLWKVWYFFAVFFAIIFAINPFVTRIAAKLGITGEFIVYGAIFLISITFTILKIFRPNVYTHNLTEVLMYGGISAILVPMNNLWSVSILLILISLYDAYAVWKSKHMIKLAEFQKSTNLFAGFYLPYTKMEPKTNKNVKKASKQIESKNIKLNKADANVGTAILGGGDIAFPLIFSGVVMATWGTLLYPIIISITTTIALGLLLLKANKGEFYPAMPFLSAGCFVGLFLSLLIGLL
jgi:presenilin-like A22 family membrane protease